MKNERLISFLLRAGIAVAFLYAAIAAFLDPFSWVGFMPAWIDAIVPRNMLLMIFSVYETGLALWLLSGRAAYYSAAFSSATLFFIILFNISSFDILFRDVPILFAALAMVAMTARSRTSAG
ncbi:hypothetical protein HY623_04380 [Candidatus Uhrbacteria bacterium]|nr:hypothetical protein [Candidatus Uhrbacteria bacterium]